MWWNFPRILSVSQFHKILSSKLKTFDSTFWEIQEHSLRKQKFIVHISHAMMTELLLCQQLNTHDSVNEMNQKEPDKRTKISKIIMTRKFVIQSTTDDVVNLRSVKTKLVSGETEMNKTNSFDTRELRDSRLGFPLETNTTYLNKYDDRVKWPNQHQHKSYVVVELFRYFS